MPSPSLSGRNSSGSATSAILPASSPSDPARRGEAMSEAPRSPGVLSATGTAPTGIAGTPGTSSGGIVTGPSTGAGPAAIGAGEVSGGTAGRGTAGGKT